MAGPGGGRPSCPLPVQFDCWNQSRISGLQSSRSPTEPPERMSLEQVAELQILTEGLVTLMPAEPFGLCRMHAVIHTGRQRTALQAVATKLQARESSRNRAHLDNQCEGACRQCVLIEPGQGRGR